MKTQIQQKPQINVENLELKNNKIEKVFVYPEGSIIYSASSDNAIYVLTDKNKLLIFENN
jgi:hypothetical protein